MGRRGRLPVTLAVACAASLLSAAAARGTVAVGPAGAPRADVQGAARLPRGVTPTAPLSPSRRVAVTIALKPRTGLGAYAAAVSDPRSPSYHHYLSVAGFASRFGASARDVATVRATLTQSGLRVGPLSVNGLSLSAVGDTTDVQGAFATRLDRVHLSDGRTAFADTATPSLPVAAASVVQGVIGLDSLSQIRPAGLMRAGSRPRAVATSASHAADGPQTCPASAGAGDSAQQIGSAYGLNGLWNAGDVGTGTTVALYELEPFNASDVAAYQACDGTDAPVSVIQVDGGAGTGSGSGEAALDIEDVAGLAPGATIDVYEGPNGGEGPYLTWQRIIDADSAQVISTSWGACEAQIGSTDAQEEQTLFEQAAAQGQTIYAAAGDSGADDCGSGTAAVDDPASQPDVTGVGGTTMGSYLSPAAETVWNDSSTHGGAGGGGVSALWSAPSWQSAATGSAPRREVPDVSADADPETGYAIYFEGGWGEFGGTSAAAPTWAALTALAERSSWCAGKSLGLLNPTLYTVPESDFYDITSGNNSDGGVPGYTAAAGYDMASGLGAPDGARLVPALCGASTGTTVTEPASGSTPTTTPTPPPTTPPTTTTTTTATTTTTTPTTTGTTTTSPGPPATTPATTPTATPTTSPLPTTAAGSAGATTTGGGSHAAPVTLAAPTRLHSLLGAHVRESLHAADRDGRHLRFDADGLPPGLRIDHATGVITGRPRRTGTFTVTVNAVDTAGNAHSAVIRWTISARAHTAGHRRREDRDNHHR